MNDRLDFWVRVAQIIATAAAAVVAWYVGWNWHRTLRNQRLDECVAAVHEVMGLVNRCLSLKEDARNGQDQVWSAYTEAWNSWRKFSAAVAVVRRYDKFPEDTRDHIVRLLFEVRELCKQQWKEGEGIKPQVRQGRDRIKSELKSLTEQVEAAAKPSLGPWHSLKSCARRGS